MIESNKVRVKSTSSFSTYVILGNASVSPSVKWGNNPYLLLSQTFPFWKMATPMVQLKALEIFLARFFLLYIFHIQCISNCIENSTTSHHFYHHSPSQHLLLTLAAFYFLSCGLSHSRRSESCETQLTSWHLPAQRSSSHSRKSKILTPTRACMTRMLSFLPAFTSTASSAALQAHHTYLHAIPGTQSTCSCLRAFALLAPVLIRLFPACLLGFLPIFAQE